MAKRKNVKKRRFEAMRGDISIRGIEYRPEGGGLPPGAKFPIAIVCHGFMSNCKSTKRYARRFAEWGYAAYCFDFAGGGAGCKSGGKMTGMSVLTEKEDLHAVIDYAKILPFTDEGDITLAGFSQGGFVAALAAAELKDEVSKLVLVYPALCIPDDARRGKMIFFEFDPADIPEVISYGPAKIGGVYVRDVIGMDPYEEIAGYGGPVLILHGAGDRLVDLSYSAKAKSVYGGNCSLCVLPKAGHGFKKREDKYAFFAIKEFLDGKVELMTLDIRLKKRRVTEKKPDRKIAIPFTGTASGSFFCGRVMPGAVDVRTWRKSAFLGCRAEYVLSGKDCAGEDCEIHVVNTSQDGKSWSPRLSTESRALAFLNGMPLDAHFSKRRKGPLIRFFGKV